MKKLILSAIVFGLFAFVLLIGVKHFFSSPATHGKSIATSTGNHPVTAPTAHPATFVGADEWPKYRDARQSALASNPLLRTEYTEVLKEVDDQQSKLDAAMTKADPTVAPVIAKLVALRQKNGGPLASHPSGSPSSPTPALTSDDMQHLRTARVQAMQANPNLATENKAIADKMRTFENNLDAAMIKADPNVALIITKFEAGRRPAVASSAPTSPK